MVCNYCCKKVENGWYRWQLEGEVVDVKVFGGLGILVGVYFDFGQYCVDLFFYFCYNFGLVFCYYLVYCCIEIVVCVEIRIV